MKHQPYVLHMFIFIVRTYSIPRASSCTFTFLQKNKKSVFFGGGVTYGDTQPLSSVGRASNEALYDRGGSTFLGRFRTTLPFWGGQPNSNSK